LPPREWRNGVVEMIKHSLIANASVFDVLYQNVDAIKQHDSDCLLDMIYASCLIKKDIVEQDEQEHGIRKLLNFGHTIGHAIELRENHEIDHGEAVAIGMLVEGYLSVLHGYMEEATLVRIEKILRLYGLPLQTLAFQDKVAFEKVLMMDKKAILNVPSFVLLEDIGHPHIHHNQYSMPVNPAHLTRALDWAATYFRPIDVTC
jgi:3-dehydroquinate synthase